MGKATQAITPEARLKAIGRRRALVLKLRPELTRAKEHVKELTAELKQALEELLTETEQPSLPFDEPG